MVDFRESEKMIKISVKANKSNTYKGFTGNISFFIYPVCRRSENKERNITKNPSYMLDLSNFHIYANLPGVYHSGKGINSWQSRNANVFLRIEHSGIGLREM